jgi:hypothetical protein
LSQYLLSSTGYNVALVDLDPIVPQPRSDGVAATRRSFSANGGVYEAGLFVQLEWSLLGSAAQYRALLTQFGLLTTTTAEVTVQVRDHAFNWIRFNGVAVRPDIGKDIRWDIFPRGITLLIRELEVSL